MPVHFFAPPSLVRQAEGALREFVAGLEANGEVVQHTMPYGALVAIFTTKPVTANPPRKAVTR